MMMMMMILKPRDYEGTWPLSCKQDGKIPVQALSLKGLLLIDMVIKKHISIYHLKIYVTFITTITISSSNAIMTIKKILIIIMTACEKKKTNYLHQFN